MAHTVPRSKLILRSPIVRHGKQLSRTPIPAKLQQLTSPPVKSLTTNLATNITRCDIIYATPNSLLTDYSSLQVTASLTLQASSRIKSSSHTTSPLASCITSTINHQASIHPCPSLELSSIDPSIHGTFNLSSICYTAAVTSAQLSSNSHSQLLFTNLKPKSVTLTGTFTQTL